MVLINKKEILNNLKISQEVWKSFCDAGLPVAEFKKINIDKDPNYLDIIFKEMNERYGKLTSCHKNGVPVELKKFKKNKDEKILQYLGKDLARTYNLGFYPPKINFWNFYNDKKNSCTDRVIISLDSFKKIEKKDEYVAIYKATAMNLKDIKSNMGEEEFLIFLSAFTKAVNKKNFKAIKHAATDSKIVLH